MKTFTINTILMLCFTLACTASLQAQGWAWAETTENEWTDEVSASVTDASGNTYICGVYTDTIWFTASVYFVNPSNALTDFYLAKYDKDGSFIWARNGYGPGNDYANAVGMDANGNLYVTGELKDTLHIGDSTIVEDSQGNVYIAKYSSSGNLLWTEYIDITVYEEVNDIAVAANGDFYICGRFGTNAVFAGFGYPSMASIDAYLAKYDKDANLQWVEQVFGTLSGGSSLQYGEEVAISPNSDYVYLAGYYQGTVTWGGVGGTTISYGGVQEDWYLARYDSAGVIDWVSTAESDQVESSPQSYMRDLTCDPSGNPILVGELRGELDFGSSSFIISSPSASTTWHRDAVIFKFNPTSGALSWGTQVIDEEEDTDFTAVTTDASGNIYVSGIGDGLHDFNGLNATIGTGMVYIAKYNSSGSCQWLKQTETDFLGAGETRGIGLDSDGKIYIAGFYSYGLRFDGTLIESTGFRNSFVAKCDESLSAITDPLEFKAFSIAPNPSSGKFMLDFQGKQTQDLELQLISVNGQVFHGQIYEQAAGIKQEFDVQLPAGTYLLNITNNKGQQSSQPLIIQH